MTTTITPMSETALDTVADLAAQLRVDSIRSSTSAGSGHPTSSMSAADLLAVLVTRHLRYDWDDPRSLVNDHLIFSKGHASPLLYAVFKAVGVVSEQELMTGYRRFGQRLEGHPTPILPWVDVATGSLGQGLPDGVGVALAGKYLEQRPYRVWVPCGDSELGQPDHWNTATRSGDQPTEATKRRAVVRRATMMMGRRYCSAGEEGRAWPERAATTPQTCW